MTTNVMDKSATLAAPDLNELLTGPSVMVAALEDKSFSATGSLNLDPAYLVTPAGQAHLPAHSFMVLLKNLGTLLADAYFWLSGPPMMDQARTMLTARAAQIHLKHWDI